MTPGLLLWHRCQAPRSRGDTRRRDLPLRTGMIGASRPSDSCSSDGATCPPEPWTHSPRSMSRGGDVDLQLICGGGMLAAFLLGIIIGWFIAKLVARSS